MTERPDGRRAWLLVALLLAAAAGLGRLFAAETIDWQPALGLREPWRALSAVGVHYSRMHLIANLAGLALVALLGWVARVPAPLAGAWLLAWPATQFGLWLQPALTHYGGLSGVLHAGVAVVVTFLLLTGTRAQRAVAGLLLAGLLLKLWNEAPWGEPLRYPSGWDIAVAPLGHATGTLAGALFALCALCAMAALRTPPLAQP